MTIAVVFPGQGSQFAGMADPWVEHPAGRAVVDEASDAMGRDLAAGAHDEAALATTEFVQPALLACGVAAFRVLEAEGLTGVVGAAGHSLGEFSALVAAGVLPLAGALRVVVVRGEAMQRAGEARPGTMTALLGRRPRRRRGALRRGSRRRRAARREPQLPRAVGDQRLGAGDRARRGARRRAEDPRGAAATWPGRSTPR